MASRAPDRLVRLLLSDERYVRLAERIDAQDSLLAFCQRMDPTYERAAHADLLIAHLEAVERGEITRLAVFMPPRHSKTLHVSERFPAWFLGRDPDTRVILASYGAELAERSSRSVRHLLQDERWPWPNVRVAADSGAVNRWGTNHGGEIIAAGVGGAMTGFGADLLVLDDVVKGRQEADSETVRENTWDWYSEVARTRLMPRGRVVLCMTRWHADDLAGRILSRAGRDGWTVLSLPAVATDASDPLGRQVGDPLWPAWFGTDELAALRAELSSEQGSRAWTALYQQSPTEDEGGMFRRSWFPRYQDRPDCTFRVLGVDAAFKDGIHNDESALVHVGATATDYPVLDVRSGRWEYPDLKRAILEAAASWQPHAIVIEDTASGQSVIQELRRTSPLPIVPVTVSASKQARAQAVAPMCESGRVPLPNTSTWGGLFLDQLAAFPTGAHDDLVDAFVHALGYAITAMSEMRPLQASPVTLTSQGRSTDRGAFERMQAPRPAGVRR